jgi:hypothetical protein
MDLLFPIKVEPSDIPQIPGLAYHPAYISHDEELELVREIERGAWNNSWDRRRQLYGGSYGRDEGPVEPIPAWGTRLAVRMLDEGHTERPFDHMLINEYLPGQGIALHRDHQPFGRTVVSLSLISPCVMDFRDSKGSERQALLLEQRSLLVLSADARYRWQHGIARRKNDRWHGVTIPRGRRLSITFRWRREA